MGALVLLAPVANVEYLRVHASAHQALDCLSVNDSALLGLVLGILGTTGVEAERLMRSGDGVLALRAALGAKARAYAVVAFVSAPVFCLMGAAVALPLLSARGLPWPHLGEVVPYVEREAVAAARLAVIGVSIGVAAGRRSLAIAALLAFLVAEDVAAAHIAFIRDYGPIGALNAFSDPTHAHKLSVAAGGAVALAWALASLIAASIVLDLRRRGTLRRRGGGFVARGG